METIIMTERRSKCTVNLIFFALLLTGVLISIKYSAVLLSVIFIVSLIIPSVGIVAYMRDIPAKIELSKDQVVIYYGRSILNDGALEGRFTFPLVDRIKWKNIIGFNLKSCTHVTRGTGDDAGTKEDIYHYLVISDRSVINLNANPNERCKIRLNRFEKTPEEILIICRQFQKECTSSNSSS